MDQLTLTRPDDWHIHLRDDAALTTTVPHVARCFGRAIVMPNLVPPVTTTRLALAYRQRILAAVPAGAKFTPLMTLYLTDDTPTGEITQTLGSSVSAVKLYPVGATTNSAAGVTDIRKTFNVLAEMERCGMPLLLHGESVGKDIDIFDRERIFIDRELAPLVRQFPELKIVFEHITTRAAVDFVISAPATVAATITAHHLLLNRNAMLAGGIRPHHYCLPVLKRETDRQALVSAATGGNPKFFLGTDSAPHAKHTKEAACGCAGIYTAHAAIELYAQVFDKAGKLDRLENFASRFGPAFYGLPINDDSITLQRADTPVAPEFALGKDKLVPFMAGGTVGWQLMA
ncbi:MAG: dihydroorotase [Gammaproteobacteria bacterium]|nr:MAG: dihydroorotase [Gammaproteobacteria bacterium]TND04488.1 MAG: dihydroorotase [Gammaproteobacteria bacterium]